MIRLITLPRKIHKRLFFLLLALLPTQLGFHFWPEWAFVLGRRVDYLSPTLYVTDVLLFMTIATWLFTGKLGGLGGYGKLGVFILLFAVVNIWFSASPWVALYKWLKVLEFAVLGLYIVKTKPTIIEITLPLMIGMLYSSAIAILQFALQHSLGGVFWYLGERTFSITTPGIARFDGIGLWLRPYATFPHPNVLGGYLAVTFPLLFLLHERHVIIIKRVAIFLGCIALSFTFSRSAWIAAGLGIGATYFLSTKKNIFLFLTCVFLFSATILLRPAFTDESFVQRSELNHAAISMWQSSPILGVGLGNFLVRLPEFSTSRNVNFLQPVHNIYLLVLTEVGIIGLFAIVILVIMGMKGTWGMYKISFACILFLGLFDHYPLTLQQGQLLFTILFALMLQ